MRPPNEYPPHTELSRQAVHMLVAVFALLLRWLSYPQALACAVAAIVFNAFILPRLPGGKRYLFRAEERERGFSRGILTYPISVFLLILIFPVPVAAAMWGALSFGDGLATLVGTRAGTRAGSRAGTGAGARAGGGPLPWNPKKTAAGLIAFVLGATPSVAFLYWWTLPNAGSSPPWWRSAAAQAMFNSPQVAGILAASLVAAAACAFLESLDTRIDDNLLAPLGGAIFMTGLIYALS